MSSSDRRSYLYATLLDQTLLNNCADNFETRIEMVVDIEKPGGGYIYASDRNKYVDGIFYEALLTFPTITRTVGEWLSPTLQFSTVTLELSNADGRFNKYLPGGDDYDSFIGKNISVKIGLAEQLSTYKIIFSGKITEVGGFSRSTYSVTFLARDEKEKLAVVFPTLAISPDIYPYVEDNISGKLLPVIYGNFTVSLTPDAAIIPAYVINGKDPQVIDEDHNARTNLKLIIASHNLSYFRDPLEVLSNVWLLKGDVFWEVPFDDIVYFADNNNFEIDQHTSHTWYDGKKYIYESGDQFYVRVKGFDLGIYSDNIIAQAKHILTTYGGLQLSDFDSNWDYYQNKSSPAQSNILNIKSRIWENEPKPVIEYALSLLEQVRLEAFIDDNLKLKINSLHFEDWNSNPEFTVKNYDVVEKTLKPKIDERNNFNRAQATFDYHPNRNEQAQITSVFKNDDSFNQIGKFISKRINFPNLYLKEDVTSQLIEILKISSSLFEIIEVNLTWRSFLLDVGDFVFLNIEIGSIIYENVPAMIRSKGYNPSGVQIEMNLWCMQLLPFPGYLPGFPGTVGGYNQTITQE